MDEANGRLVAECGDNRATADELAGTIFDFEANHRSAEKADLILTRLPEVQGCGIARADPGGIAAGLPGASACTSRC